MGKPLIISKATPALAAMFAPWQETFIWAVLEGQGGRFCAVDEQPKAAICENGDFVFLAGNADESETLALLQAWGECSQGFHIIVPHDVRCAQLIETVFAPRVKRTQRFAFCKDASGFDGEHLRTLSQSAPQDVRIVPFDRALYKAALQNEWSRDFCSQFCDADDYLSRGVGFAALHNGCLVGGASSYIRTEKAIEIQVETHPEWRRQGIATACSAALISECLRRGIYPSWDAANEQSARIAERLGYRSDGTYSAWFVDIRK